MARSLLYRLLCDVLSLLVLRRRGDAANEVEILVLRHQVAVLLLAISGRPLKPDELTGPEAATLAERATS